MEGRCLGSRGAATAVTCWFTPLTEHRECPPSWFYPAEYRIYRHTASFSCWCTDCPLSTRPFVVKTTRESKEKRASCPCLYYANSTACRRILLCAGDISPNPGPVTKCYKCEKPVKKNQFSLHCSACYNLYHVNCTDPKQTSKSVNLGTWTCSCCLWSTLPFNHVRSDCLDQQATETSSHWNFNRQLAGLPSECSYGQQQPLVNYAS